MQPNGTDGEDDGANQDDVNIPNDDGDNFAADDAEA